jgi:hypothetical protein
MNNQNLIQLIKESIQSYISEIDYAGENAACEAKINAIGEAITTREKKMNMEGIDEAYHDMIDKDKMKELASEIKTLKKSLAKYQKQLEKLKSKGKKVTKTEETEEKEIVDEVTLPEDEMNNEYENMGMEEDMNIYEVLHMQKIAGIITEDELIAKLEEAKKKPSAGMTKKEKSAVAKKAHAGKDIGKKGKGFEKVAKAAEKEYGSEEAGKKVAAAAMWKGEAKKAKSLKEEVLALFKND